MKRILMAVALIVVFATASLSAKSTGIINRHDRSMLGGAVDLSSLGTSSGSNDLYSDLQFNCQLFSSEFLSDNIALGIGLNLNYNNRTYDDNLSNYYYSDIQTLTALLMPHIRFYLADNTFLHLEAGGGYLGYIGANGDGDAMYGGGISIGRDFPLSNDIFLEAAVGYNLLKHKEHFYDYYDDYTRDVTESTIKVSLGVVATF